MASMFRRRGVRRDPERTETAAPPRSANEVVGGRTADASGIEGHIDLIDGERVAGWAYDAGAPGRRLLIEISAGDTVEVVLANLDREDLRIAGKGDGLHGFDVRLDIASTGADIVHVRAVATGQDLIGSPASTDFSELIAQANEGRSLEFLKTEAQLALLTLKGTKKR